MKGIDVSVFQDQLDLSKTGLDFAIIRGGYGNVISQKDRSFDYHVQNALKANMKIGVYWFSYAVSAEDAKKEADVCAAVIQKYKDQISLPVFFDWEYASNDYCIRQGITPTKAMVTNFTIAFIERMKAHGYEAGYYTNLDYMSRMLDYEQVKKYPLWLAQYEGEAKYPYKVRQTTASGKVTGFSGNVDLDEMDGEEETKTYKEIRINYGDIIAPIAKEYGCTEDAILKLNGRMKNEIVTSIRVPMKSIDEVAREVIAGKWGYFPFRSARLKAAGYDPEAVQKRVNELLK